LGRSGFLAAAPRSWPELFMTAAQLLWRAAAEVHNHRTFCSFFVGGIGLLSL
jgi:hypothetical protein